MRIISDFRDYYDPVQATGQDRTLLYLRTRKEIVDPGSFPKSGWYPDYVLSRYNARVVIRTIGFCGTIYPLVEFSFSSKTDVQRKDYCYTVDEIDSVLRETLRHRELEAYLAKPRRKWRVGSLSRQWIAKFFSECEEKKIAYRNIFIDNHCPVFVKTRSIVLNEQLQQFEFCRIVDTFQAFQEIAGYLDNLAQPRKEIPTISDKDMVGIKGFDKWSFRKPPSKKR